MTRRSNAAGLAMSYPGYNSGMPRPLSLRSVAKPVIETLTAAPPEKRIKIAFALNNELLEIQSEIAAARRGAVRELRAQGWTLKQIADAGAVSLARVKQIQDGSGQRTKRTHEYTPVPRPPGIDVFDDEWDTP